MDISVDAEVYCTDGHYGRSTLIILDPTNEKVTHVVVRESRFPHAQFLVPVEWIVSSEAKSIQLKCQCKDVTLLDPFIEKQYIPSDLFSYGADPFLFQPYVIPEKDFINAENEGVPAGELAVRRGTRVKATDGYIGHVNELLIDPKTRFITHLVLREGHLWGQKEVTIPVAHIERIEEDTVYLKLNKADIEALSPIPIRRH
jgi:sporulation protein YlmC with PRC-barrel domain